MRKNFGRIVGNSRACGTVHVVAGTYAGTRLMLDEYLMAMMDEFADTRRCQSDAVFVILDFSWYTDEHSIDLAIAT
jgi:hypothetical protein